jgi:DNA-binding MarR family transcriptional regulator
MHSAEGLKRLLYNHLLHFEHLTEQFYITEMDTFTELTRQYGLSFVPNNMTLIHVLDCIGTHEPINHTSIAAKMNLSKASITKISVKLLEEGCIKRNQLNDNKKEVYFSLTPKGRQLYDVHARMHEMIEQRFIESLTHFTEPELQASLKFFQTMIAEQNTFITGEEFIQAFKPAD